MTLDPDPRFVPETDEEPWYLTTEPPRPGITIPLVLLSLAALVAVAVWAWLR